MKSRIEQLKRPILALLCLLSYSVSWTAMQNTAELLYADRFVQLLIIYAALGLCSIPALLFKSSFTSALLFLGCALLAFIANASGPDISILLPLLLPLLLIFTLSLRFALSIAACVLLYIILLSTLQPHSAWGMEIPGIELHEALLLLGTGLTVICAGVFLRQQDLKTASMAKEYARLDEAYKKLADVNLDFQTYALFAKEEAMEKERKRLAGELHDIIGYTLTNLIMLIQAAQYGKGGPEETGAILEKARLHADSSLKDARLALSALRERRTDRPKGAQLLLRLVENFEDITGVKIIVDFTHFPSSLGLETEKLIYRIIQEGLTNAFRHGKASEVTIHFWTHDGFIFITLRDNGKTEGLIKRDGNKKGGIGLAGLQELTESMGGMLDAEAVSDGFSVKARVPVKEQQYV